MKFYFKLYFIIPVLCGAAPIILMSLLLYLIMKIPYIISIIISGIFWIFMLLFCKPLKRLIDRFIESCFNQWGGSNNGF